MFVRALVHFVCLFVCLFSLCLCLHTLPDVYECVGKLSGDNSLLLPHGFQDWTQVVRLRLSSKHPCILSHLSSPPVSSWQLSHGCEYRMWHEPICPAKLVPFPWLLFPHVVSSLWAHGSGPGTFSLSFLPSPGLLLPCWWWYRELYRARFCCISL